MNLENVYTFHSELNYSVHLLEFENYGLGYYHSN